MRNSSQNQQWIATRPQHTQELMTKFNQRAYKLYPYNGARKKEFIQKVLATNFNISNEKIANEIFKIIDPSISNYYLIDSPLMLRMITELYINDEDILRDSNLYLLYAKMIQMKKRILIDKGEIVNDDRDNEKSSLTIWQVHQIYALKLLYSYGFADPFNDYYTCILINKQRRTQTHKIDELSLLVRWNKSEKSKWTPEAISRYGFLIIDNFHAENEYPDFSHRSFAEFFLAQFLIENIYEEYDETIIDSEMKLRVKFLIFIIMSKYDDEKKFIRSFIEKSENRQFNGKIFEFITSDDMSKFLKCNINHPRLLNLIRDFLSVDERFLIQFKFDDGETIFQKYIKNTNKHCEIMRIYESKYGVEWIKYTGYSLQKSNLNEVNENIFEKSSNLNDENEYETFYKLLHLIELVNIDRSDFLIFLRLNFYTILKNSFKSSSMTEKLIKIINKHFNDSREKFNDILSHEMLDNLACCPKDLNLLNDEYLANILHFCKNSFILSLNVGIFAMFCGLKYLRDLYTKHNCCTHSEVQHFFANNSVVVFECLAFCGNGENVEIILDEIFLNAEKSCLRKFFELRHEGKNRKSLLGHSVLSLVEKEIECYKDDEGFCEKITALKSYLIKLAKNAGSLDDTIACLRIKSD